MIAEIITVGTELLMGQILNTNAQFLAQQINELGFNHYIETVVGDNPERLKKVLKQAEERSDIILITGGLGPTQDDLTKETVADYLSETLIYDQEGLSKIKNYFVENGVMMTNNNEKMALTFENGISFKNPTGQAVGTAIEKEGHLYILLPGPPRELQPMFREEVHPYLAQYSNEDIFITSKFLNYYGIGESALATKLHDIIEKQSNPSVAIYVSDAGVTVRLTAYGKNIDENTSLLDEAANNINDIVGEWFYGEGYEYSPAHALLDYLIETDQTISFAESLTGGDAANQMVNLEGTSAVFRGSAVVYDAYAKEHILGVSQQTIEEFGTVSAECASEMAEQALEKFQTDISIGFTGVAGPASLEGHKAGTVFVAIARKNKQIDVLKLSLWGGRKGIRMRAINQAFLAAIEKNA